MHTTNHRGVTYAAISAAIDAEPNNPTRKILRTTLNDWLRVHHKTLEDSAAALGEADFAAYCEIYYADPEFKQHTAGTRANRRTTLTKKLVNLYRALCPAEVPSGDISHPFWREVEQIVAEGSVQIRTRSSLYRRLQRKFLPQNVERCKELACCLGVSPDRLLRHLWFWKPQPLFDLNNPSYTFNERQAEVRQLTYMLSEIPTVVGEALTPYRMWRRATHNREITLEHLSGESITIKRRGSWSHRGGQSLDEAPEAEVIFVKYVKEFFSFASLPKNADEAASRGSPDPANTRLHGLGIPVAELRLSHFLLHENVGAFCDFKVRRQGRFDHAGAANLQAALRTLLGTADSYVRHAQRRLCNDLWDVLGEATPQTSAQWAAWCDTQWKGITAKFEALTAGRTGNNKFVQHRSPEKSLRFLLEKAAPIEEIVWPTILTLADNRPPIYWSLHDRLDHEAKIFTITSLIVEPLRLINWQNMKWGQNLYLKNGVWCVSIPKEEMKNRRLLKDDYYSTIEDAAKAYFDEYYDLWKEYWGYDPLSAEHRSKKSYVHATRKNESRGRLPTCPGHHVLKRRLKILKLLWGITVGPHAFRHIWATDWLKRHPEAWSTVAGKLNDSVKTVLKVYGHLSARDHARTVNAANAGVLERARQHLDQARRRAA